MKTDIFEKLGKIENGIDNISKSLDEQKKEIKEINHNYNELKIHLCLTEKKVEEHTNQIESLFSKQALLNGHVKEKQKIIDIINFAIHNPRKLVLIVFSLVIITATGSGTYIFVNSLLQKLDKILNLLKITAG